MKINKFEDLEIWKSSIKITKVIYDLTISGNFSKDFGLRDQIRGASVSISSNIVEGFEKNNNNEFIRFLKMAKGSSGEARNQLLIAFTVGHINKEAFKNLSNDLEKLSAQIGALIGYLERKRTAGEFIKKIR